MVPFAYVWPLGVALVSGLSLGVKKRAALRPRNPLAKEFSIAVFPWQPWE